MTHLIRLRARPTLALLIMAVTVAMMTGCAGVPSEQTAPVTPAPDLAPVPPPPQVGEPSTATTASALDAEQAENDSAAGPTARQRRPGGVVGGLFPGLRQNRTGTAGAVAAQGTPEADAAGARSDVPFERSVTERRKRIDLGLEPTRKAEEPVNNVLDLEF